MTDNVDKLLARSMEPIVEAIGFDLAIALVSRFGGVRLAIPANAGPRDSLSMAIGIEGARLLTERLGPCLIELPRCANWLTTRRNEEIVTRWDHGETQAELALRFHLTERQIRNIVAAARGDGAYRPNHKPGDNLDLFAMQGDPA